MKRTAWLVVWVLSCAGCGDARPRALEWRVSFESMEAAQRLAALRARILRSSCAGSDVLYEQWLTDSGAPPLPSELPPGDWAFEATAFDTGCTAYASDCRVLQLPAKDGVTVDLVVVGPPAAAPECEASRCVSGRCTATPIDAAVVCPGVPPHGCDGCPAACASTETCIGSRCMRGGEHAWSRAWGSSALDRAVDVAVAPDGRIAVTGVIGGPVDFGGGPLTHDAQGDAFWLGLAADGSHVTSRVFGSSGDDSGNAIAFGPRGETWIGGRAAGAVDFGAAVLTPTGPADAFIAVYDEAERLFWADLVGGGGGDDAVYDIVVQPSGAAVVGGRYEGDATFGGPTFPAAGGTDAFVVSLSTSGDHRWSRGFGGTADDQVTAVATDATGRVYAVGDFRVSVDFGEGEVVASGARDGFILALEADGRFRWARTWGGVAATVVPNDIVVDARGRIVVVGRFDGTVSFGKGSVVGDTDAFVIGVSADGTTTWQRILGGPSPNTARSAAADGFGNVFVTGSYGSAIDVGGATLAHIDAEEVFVAAYDGLDGAHQWSRGFPAPMLQSADAVAIDRNGFVVVGGRFMAGVDFGGGGLADVGGGDVFVARFLD